MNTQITVAALLVVACSLYACWTLMPRAAQRALAGALLKLPLPRVLARHCRQVIEAPTGCACDGCDRYPGPVAPPAASHPVTFHPRVRR